jgi:hypothetical protein
MLILGELGEWGRVGSLDVGPLTRGITERLTLPSVFAVSGSGKAGLELRKRQCAIAQGTMSPDYSDCMEAC